LYTRRPGGCTIGSKYHLAGRYIPYATRILAIIGGPKIVLGIIAIVGGIYAIRKRAWGMALAGAICVLLIPPPFILGILAIVFITMDNDEFK
jgi:hypothetical protein